MPAGCALAAPAVNQVVGPSFLPSRTPALTCFVSPESAQRLSGVAF